MDERKETTDDALAATTEENKVSEEKKEETKQALKQDADVEDEKSGKNKQRKRTVFQLIIKTKSLCVTHVCLRLQIEKKLGRRMRKKSRKKRDRQQKQQKQRRKARRLMWRKVSFITGLLRLATFKEQTCLVLNKILRLSWQQMSSKVKRMLGKMSKQLRRRRRGGGLRPRGCASCSTSQTEVSQVGSGSSPLITKL